MEEARDVFPWRPTTAEIKDPMEFLSRSWSASGLEVSKTLSTSQANNPNLPHLDLPPQAEDAAGEVEDSPAIAGNTFSFASSTTSQLVMERIMSQSVSNLFEFMLAVCFCFGFMRNYKQTNCGFCLKGAIFHGNCFVSITLESQNCYVLVCQIFSIYFYIDFY